MTTANTTTTIPTTPASKTVTDKSKTKAKTEQSKAKTESTKAPKRDCFNSRRGTRCATINSVVIGLKSAATCREIEEAAEKLAKGRVRAVRNYLAKLLRLQLVTVKEGRYSLTEKGRKLAKKAK